MLPVARPEPARRRTTSRRLAGAAVATLVALGAGTGVAAAHVTVNPAEATRGGYAKLTFRVPNERDDAATVSVAVAFPDDQPVRVRVRPTPGWTAQVENRTVDGEESTATVTWTGGRIEPGEFQEFEVSGGPLPDTDRLVLPAVQTYENGEVVRWIQELVEGGAEPERPAPVLRLVEGEAGDGHSVGAGTSGTGGDGEQAAGAGADDAADADDDSTADTALVLAIVALALSVVGMGLAASGARRRRT